MLMLFSYRVHFWKLLLNRIETSLLNIISVGGDCYDH